MNRGTAPRTGFRSSTLVALLGLTALLACGPPRQLVNQWKDPQYPKTPLRNVLVVVLKTDPAIRRLWEDSFVAALQKDGVRATPSYRLFPGALPDTNSVITAVRREQFDGVVVTRRLNDQTQSVNVPPSISTEPVTRYDPWLNVFYTDYQDIYQPGYVENEKVVRHRTDVWTTGRDGHMVWSATSEVTDPRSNEAVESYVAGMVVPNLKKSRVT